MSIYGIYDLKNKEQCITVGTLQEIANFLGLSTRTFNNVLRKGIYEERYVITYVYNEDQDVLNSKINIDFSRFNINI